MANGYISRRVFLTPPLLPAKLFVSVRAFHIKEGDTARDPPPNPNNLLPMHPACPRASPSHKKRGALMAFHVSEFRWFKVNRSAWPLMLRVSVIWFGDGIVHGADSALLGSSRNSFTWGL